MGAFEGSVDGCGDASSDGTFVGDSVGVIDGFINLGILEGNEVSSVEGLFDVSKEGVTLDSFVGNNDGISDVVIVVDKDGLLVVKMLGSSVGEKVGNVDG